MLYNFWLGKEITWRGGRRGESGSGRSSVKDDDFLIFLFCFSLLIMDRKVRL